MADFEPPSFSLGLDFEPQPEPQTQLPILLRQHSAGNRNPSSSAPLNDHNEDEKFGLHVMDSDPETGPTSHRVFKRLRRGPGSGPAIEESRIRKIDKLNVACDNGDDEIEEFSSQEDFVRDAYMPAEYNSVSSSSKVPLRGSGAVTAQSSNQLKGKKPERALDTPSSSLGNGGSGVIFPNLTISPLRKFQLIDSDSDEPSMDRNGIRKISKGESYSKEICDQKGNQSVEKKQNEDLWKDFHPMRSSHIPTPVLDEVCEEYFQSLRDIGNNMHKVDKVSHHLDANTTTGFEQSWNLANPLPPAHHYYFHDDSRIQLLVRCRLPNFSPLGIVNNRGNHKPTESVINYMSQFSGEASKKGGVRTGNKQKGSTRGKKGTKKSNAKEATNPSQGWIDPKSRAAIPKDAGKRRVQANGEASGHWYTSPEGRKVYVSRSGQELTGQMAYRHYKKENVGFRKLKKKTNVKRKKS